MVAQLVKLKEFSLMGWMILDEDRFMLSDQGCLVLDELVGHFRNGCCHYGWGDG